MSESAGQQSIERLCTGHPLALARLKELMLAEARYNWLRTNSTQPAEGWSTHSCPESLDAEIDKAIAEGGR